MVLFLMQARQKAQQEAEASAKQQAAEAAKQKQAAAAAAAAKPPPAAPKAAAPKAAPVPKPVPKATPPAPQVDKAEAAKRREAGVPSHQHLFASSMPSKCLRHRPSAVGRQSKEWLSTWYWYERR